MEVYFESKKVLDVTKRELSHLLQTGVVILINNTYRLNRNCEEIKYLFSSKIAFHKKLRYLEHINDVNLVCEDCGKKYAFHVRPYIDENQNVDFHKIICVCKDCRTKKLSDRNILKPQFKIKINWLKEKENINREIEMKNISQKDIYLDLKLEIIKLESFCNLVLPPINIISNKMHEQFILLNEKLGDNLNLQKKSIRIKIRNFLYKECNGYCPVCGKQIDSHDITIDHIIAKNLKGTNSLNNFIGMCGKCNEEKSNKPVLEFLCSKELYKMPTRILQEAYKQQEVCKKLLIEKKEELKKVI